MNELNKKAEPPVIPPTVLLLVLGYAIDAR